MAESTITPEQQQAIANRLASIPHLAKGMGTVDAPCSIAAINLALKGRLTDETPECMSKVVGCWIRVVQDRAPSELCRDNPRWRELLPLAAGTGRGLETERLQLILNWMWGVLAQPAVVGAVPDAAKSAWAEMLDKRTAEAADVVRGVTRVAADANIGAPRVAAYASIGAPRVAAYAADAVDYAAAAVVAADDATCITDVVAAYAADATAYAAYAAAYAVAYAAGAAGVADVVDVANVAGPSLWTDADPVEVLERLIEIGANDD